MVKRCWRIWPAVMLVLMMCWAVMRIFQYVNVDVVPVSRYHWEILCYEMLLLAGAYGLLGITAKRKNVKR